MKPGLAVSIALLLLCPSARAGTVSVRATPSAAPGSEVVYLAGAGETNDVAVIFSSDKTAVRVSDPQAVVTAGSGCVSVDEHTATCTSGSPDFGVARVALADRADRVTAGVELGAGPNRCGCSLVATGGPGNDQLLGGAAPDALGGGPGNDQLEGGPGGDRLNGGGGADTINGGADADLIADGDGAAPDRDVLDGGAGGTATARIEDVLSYADRPAGVSVDLRSGVVVEAGEADQISGFESVAGSPGDDTLIGDAGRNIFWGGAGDDVLEGRGGPPLEGLGDILIGGEGDDRVVGGSGPERVAGGPGRDTLRCGAARDLVAKPEAFELLRRDCEAVEFLAFEEYDLEFRAHPVRTTASGPTFRLECPTDPDDVPARCRGRLALRKATGRKRLLGVAFFRGRGRDSFAVTVRLTRVGRRLAGRPRGVAVNAHVFGTGHLPDFRWTIRLRI